MIQAKGKTFLLQGKNYSYAMHVLETGFLQHLHYGGKVTQTDLEYLIGIGDTNAPHNDINKDMAFDRMLSEYGFYARGDYREPTAIFERKDGASMSRLRYEGYRIEKGAPKIEGMPHVRKGGETLVITLKDDFSDIAVDLYYTVSDDSDVLVRNAAIRNTGTEAIALKRRFPSAHSCRTETIKCFGLRAPGDRSAFPKSRRLRTAPRGCSRSWVAPRTIPTALWES